MNTLFADSFYFLAAINSHDEAHFQVREFAEAEPNRLITTEWVLTEVGDAFSKLHWRAPFLGMMESLHRDDTVTIVRASHELFIRAVELFAKRPDKEWSLTDCTSFVVMTDYGLQEALTADHHFEQAGFVALFD